MSYKIQQYKNLPLLIRLFVLACFPFFTLITSGFAQEKNFANVKFVLNQTSYNYYQSQLQALEKSKLINREVLSKFAASLTVIEPILVANNIPDDFKFLSIYKTFQESQLSKKNVESGVFWLFTEKAASNYGLIKNNTLDERKHLLIASRAAAKRINKLHLVHNNWASTLLSMLTESNYFNSLEIKKKWKGTHVTLNSQDFNPILDFLAFKSYIETNYILAENSEHKTVLLYTSGTGKTFGQIAEELNINILEIVSSNQWLLSGKIPDKTHPVVLYVPVSRFQELKKLEESKSPEDTGFPVITPNQKISKGLGGSFFTINGRPGIQAEMGDKFVNLAYKAKISHKKFLEYNDMKPMDNITVGEIYYLKEKKKKADIPFHITQKGETLWSISQKYALKLENLEKLNRLKSNSKLQTGQLLWLQSKRPKKEPIQYVIKEESKKKTIREQPPATPKKVTPVKESITVIKPQTVEPESESKYPSVPEIEPSQNDNKTPDNLAPEKKYLVHEVLNGETLHSIASKYKVEVKQLFELNNLVNNKILVGDRLIIKKIQD